MPLERFVGKSVEFGVSDPWDFGEKYGAGPFKATIEAVAKNEVLLSLPILMEYGGLKFDKLVATARNSEHRLEDLAKGDTVQINLTPVSNDIVFQPDEIARNREITPGSPFHAAASWRGWSFVGGMVFH